MREKLRQARTAAGMTQETTAARLGITSRYYQSIEYGVNTGRAALWDALEDLFKIPQRDLRANSAKGARNRKKADIVKKTTNTLL